MIFLGVEATTSTSTSLEFDGQWIRSRSFANGELSVPSHYVFGYGSLVSAKSRALTCDRSVPALAVNTGGIARGWWVSKPEFALSALGAIKQEDALTNGVLFEVTTSELDDFDNRREIGYERRSLFFDDFTPSIRDRVERDAEIWIYLTPKRQLPSPDAPIVDVVVNGFMEHGSAFAEAFVHTTQDWNAFWIDDRKQPRYVRAENGLSNIAIGGLLERSLPTAFGARSKISP
jgi:hypothetical protein